MFSRLAATLLPLAPSSIPLLLGIVLTQTQAIIASVVVILIVLVAWKFLKLAFKIGLIAVAAIAIFFALRWAGIL